MKKILILIVSLSTLGFASCNDDHHAEGTDHDKDHMTTEMSQPPTTEEQSEIKTVPAMFTNVDAKAAGSFKQMVQSYLQVKNALVTGNSKDAAKASGAITDAMKNFDKSLLTADQKKVYDDLESELKEASEHIATNGDKIKHQRMHFAGMSESMYSLVKNFGGGQALYHDHCPMARDNKGAMWLSELKEVKNPYFGDEMLTCGSVEEMFK